MDGRPHFLLGFSESPHDNTPMLVLTPINPALDYTAARHARIYVALDAYETPAGTRH